MENKNFSSLNKKMFYGVCFVCLCVVVVSAYYINQRNKEALKQVKETQETEASLEESFGEDFPTFMQDEGGISDITVKVKEEEKQESSTSEKKDEAKKVETTTKSSPQSGTVQENSSTVAPVSEKAKEEPKQEVEEPRDDESVAVFYKEQKMLLPVDGEIVKNFGEEYSDILESWAYNNGISIAAKEGAEVKAALPGKVEKIEETEKDGVSIVLDHGNGIKTKYSNLSTKDLVKKDMEVEKGQVISGVSKEYSLGSFTEKEHIQFSVIEDGKYIDPSLRLAK